MGKGTADTKYQNQQQSTVMSPQKHTAKRNQNRIFFITALFILSFATSLLYHQHLLAFQSTPGPSPTVTLTPTPLPTQTPGNPMLNTAIIEQTALLKRWQAHDQRQADSRVGDYIRENIKIAQRKGKRRDIRITPSGYKIECANGALIEMLAIDPEGEAGGNHDLLIFSELHGWRSTAHKKMWAEMTLSPNKFGRSQRWIDTYAGYEGESPVLETLFNQAVTNGLRLFDDLEAYENLAARMFATWVTKPMFPWQTPEYYAEEAATLPQNEYDRMHGNIWTNSSETFIQPELWDACKKDELPRLQEIDLESYHQGKPLVVKTHPWVFANDAAVSGDCFGIVGVTKHYRPESKDHIFIPRYARKWTPAKGGYINFEEPENEIRRLAKEHSVICWCYDPYQMADMAHRLSRHSIGWLKEMNQGKDRNIADKMLWDMIVQRRLWHNGTLHDLKEHITNANAEITSDHKMRIVKRNESKKIDLAVCLSMAVATADYLNI